MGLIAGLKMRKIGAAGKSFSAAVPKGSKITCAVTEHGYQLKLSVELNYNAMTEAQAARVHVLLWAALSEALKAAGEGRKVNVPLFDFSELETEPKGTTKGANEL